ncbi:MAG: 30S ribosomal protein S18 [Candidatus Spechtbacteria bacterium]|nr:30S ribosomal protein S18 [Candidatus Spechtbacteria bacterium]
MGNNGMNCEFCRSQKNINWKDEIMLRNFLSEQAKILPRKKTRLCAKHQRHIAKTIKRSRIMGVLPFVAR